MNTAEVTLPEMLDVAFALAGDTLPTEHRWPLWLALVVGLGIGLLQALTQIQEQTLVFVPKIVAVFIVLLIAPFFGTLPFTYGFFNLVFNRSSLSWVKTPRTAESSC